MGKPKVLLLGEVEHAHKSWKALGELAELMLPKAKCREGFLRECKSGQLDGVFIVFRTFNSIDITGLFDEELLRELPASVEFVCHNGAGYDQIDVVACTARGIRVSNTPSAVDDATADCNMFLILGALRGFNTGMHALRRGHWRGLTPPPLGHDPQGKTLGILGMGGIGRNVRDKARVFGMDVVYHSRRRLAADLEGGAEYVCFEELLRRSDVLSLNLPLNKHTRHIISTDEFAKMKTGVVIVNTARGAVMDEDALVKALDSGHVFSCGLDVYEDEPAVHPGLAAHPNVMLVPHMGTWTVETQTKMEEWTIKNVRTVLEKRKLFSIVPEQAHLQQSNGVVKT